MAQQTHRDGDTAKTDGLEAKDRDYSNGFAVDVWDSDDERDPSMLIQGGPNGYQLDVWWGEDNSRQSNNWVRFGSDYSSDYAYDNDHTRDGVTVEATETDEGEPAIEIFDPDPRAENVGYEGATIRVTRHEDGFLVELEWLDEKKEEHQYAVVAPFYDPRIEEHRDTYYEYMLPLVDE